MTPIRDGDCREVRMLRGHRIQDLWADDVRQRASNGEYRNGTELFPARPQVRRNGSEIRFIQALSYGGGGGGDGARAGSVPTSAGGRKTPRRRVRNRDKACLDTT